MRARDQIKLNSHLYSYFLKKRVLKKHRTQDPERLFGRIRDLALLAWMNHPGFFSDGRIENLLLQKGEELSPDDLDPGVVQQFQRRLPPKESRRILFVASYLYEAGGHAKAIERLVQSFGGQDQFLALTQQREEVPVSFKAMEKEGSLQILRLSKLETMAARAATLREIASQMDRILLFIHPNDPVAVLAFAAGNLPPVIFDNHAHFSFSLGASVSDMTVSHLRYMCEMSKDRRSARNAFFFPLRYARYERLSGQSVDKEGAKKAIGLAPDDLCLMSICLGNTVFTPSREDNFFETANEIVKRYPNAHLFLIGLEEEHEHAKRYLSLDTGRVHCLGIVPDPLLYYQAADIFLDAFPYPSFGALLEAIVFGDACPLLAYGKHGSVLDSGNIFDAKLDIKPVDVNDYFRKLDEFVQSPSKRRHVVEALKEEYFEVEAKFFSRLEHLEQSADRLAHEPRLLPEGKPEFSADDLQVAGMSQLKSYPAMLEKLGETNLLGRKYMRGFLTDRLFILALFLRYGATLREQLAVLQDAILLAMAHARRTFTSANRRKR